MEHVEHYRRRLDGIVEELRELVAIETPTGNVHQMERAADWLAKRLGPHGELSREPLDGAGPMLRLRRPGSSHRIMLVGHVDTVWSVGSWPELWRRENGCAFGPGIYDMKGGLLFVIELLRRLDEIGADHPTLDIVFNPDEEVGSVRSGRHIRSIAAENDLVLVLEPTTPAGIIKLARKGSGEFRLTIRGRSAHQGVEPEAGINAIVEASHQIKNLLALEDPAKGTTIGPNTIRGGVASNVVADHVEIEIDVRAWTVGEQQRLDADLAALSPVLEGATLDLEGTWNRPPMEPTTTSIAVFERARSIGAGLGLDLEWVRWGGSSDGNLTAAVGTPTVDGLGPVGEDSHQKTEHVVIDAIPARLALFTELVLSLVDPPQP